MFHLIDKDGRAVPMRNGDPFTYSTRELAQAGARALSRDLGYFPKVVEN